MEVTITLEDDSELTLEVDFTVSPGCPAKFTGHPDAWHDGSIDELEINSAYIVNAEDEKKYNVKHIEHKYAEAIDDAIWKQLEE